MTEATKLVEARVRVLQQLTYEQACALPEVEGADVTIEDAKASITTFRQTNAYQLEGKVLVVVLAAKPGFFGITAFHIERGLVFAPTEPVRSATDLELQNSGG